MLLGGLGACRVLRPHLSSRLLTLGGRLLLLLLLLWGCLVLLRRRGRHGALLGILGWPLLRWPLLLRALLLWALLGSRLWLRARALLLRRRLVVLHETVRQRPCVENGQTSAVLGRSASVSDPMTFDLARRAGFRGGSSGLGQQLLSVVCRTLAVI